MVEIGNTTIANATMFCPKWSQTSTAVAEPCQAEVAFLPFLNRKLLYLWLKLGKNWKKNLKIKDKKIHYFVVFFYLKIRYLFDSTVILIRALGYVARISSVSNYPAHPHYNVPINETIMRFAQNVPSCWNNLLKRNKKELWICDNVKFYKERKYDWNLKFV